MGAALVVVVGGAYQLGRARADGIPTSPTMYFGATLDESGVPVSGSRDVTVRLYDAATAGSVRCETSAPGTMVAAGRLRVALDASCSSAVQANPNLWAELAVGGMVVGGRSRLGAVPYAVEAQRASELTAAASARVVNPDCPSGYTRDASATDIVLCRKSIAGGAFDEVVRVGGGPAAFWIDRYEASVWQNADGSGARYGEGAAGDDYPASFPDNGQARRTALLYAIARRDVVPSRYLTWFQMQVACRASGKRLPTNEEWQAAAMGTDDPGVSAGAGGNCLTMGTGPRATGLGGACVSAWGAQDMIGNLNEHTSEWAMAPRLDGVGPGATDVRWSAGFNADGMYWVSSIANLDNAGVTGRTPSVVGRGSWYQVGTAAGVFSVSLDAAAVASLYHAGFRCMIPRP